MIKKSISIFLVISFFTLSFISCSKYEEGPAFSLLRKITRLTGEYKLAEITENGQTVDDEFIAMLSIEKTIEKDGDGHYDISFANFRILKAPFSWSFTQDDEYLKITVNPDEVIWVISMDDLGTFIGIGGGDIDDFEDFDESLIADTFTAESRIIRLSRNELWLEDTFEEDGQTQVVRLKYEKKD